MTLALLIPGLLMGGQGVDSGVPAGPFKTQQGAGQ